MNGSVELDRAFYEREYHFVDDVVEAGEPRLRRALLQLEPLQDTVVLDLGSGVGWAAHLALQGGARLAVGLDFAARALRLGQEHIPGVSRLQGDGCHLPLTNDSVDRVLSFGSLEHFPDVPAGLREIARILRPAGVAVVVVPNFYVRTEQPRELRLSYNAWRRLFEDAGLSITSTGADRGPSVLRDHRPARIAFRAAAKLLAFVPRMQYQFIFRLEHAP